MTCHQRKKHTNEVFGYAYRMLGNISTYFTYMDKIMIKMVMATIIVKLEYAEVTWFAQMKKHIKELERIKRTANRLEPELKELTSYEILEKMQVTLDKKIEILDLISICTKIH